jgi:YD repeat-containing protein
VQSPDPATITPSVAYCYDGNTTSNGTACPISAPAANLATGQLTAVSSSASTTTYAYNDLQQIINSSQTTGGTSYGFAYSYNWAGTLFSITYPNSNRVVNFQYDSANRTTGATSGSTTYASITAFAPDSAVQSMNLAGTTMTQTTTYNSRFQPTQVAAIQTSGSANLLTLAYSYCPNFTSSCSNNNGNVWQQQISFASLPAVANTTPSTAAAFSETQQYQYSDPANRVTQASAGSSWTQPFGYDSVGNRWVNTSSLVGLPTLGAETAIACSWFNTQNRIVGWSYDEMGNILQIGTVPALSRVFLYDAENRQTSAVINNGAASTYVYDGDGRRVQMTTSTGITTFDAPHTSLRPKAPLETLVEISAVECYIESRV